VIEILEYLLKYCPFLLTSPRYRFVDSEVGSSFGDAYIVLESNALRLRFIRDRGQLFLDFQSPSQTGERHWFSIDVVRRLLTGDQPESAELDADYATFLEGNLEEIESRFAQRLDETLGHLRELERARAKELFG
jgi:hypothetical protein